MKVVKGTQGPSLRVSNGQRQKNLNNKVILAYIQKYEIDILESILM